jgi:hypothetical protein
MRSYDTLTEAMSDLRRRDYLLDYNATATHLYCAAVNERLLPNELVIQEVHRFEGDSNPDDNMVLYALESLKNPGHKGLLVAAYGAYADSASSAFMSPLKYGTGQDR